MYLNEPKTEFQIKTDPETKGATPLKRLTPVSSTPAKRLQYLVTALRQIAGDSQAKGLRAADFHFAPSIEFLLRYGVPPAVLRAASERAIRIGVSPEEVLIGQATLSEESYLDLFAEEFGTRRVVQATTLDTKQDIGEVLKSGLCLTFDPGSGNRQRLLVAVGNRKMRHWLMTGNAEKYRGRILLATQGEFESLLFRDRSGDVMNEATHGIFENGINVSAKHRFNFGQMVTVIALAALTISFGILAPVTGQHLLVGISSLAFLAAIFLRLFAACSFQPEPRAQKRLKDLDLPDYSILIALHQESRVVPILCKAMLALDYPAEKLDIKFILETDDPVTRLEIEKQNLPHRFSVLVLPLGEIKTKPRALNVALLLARGELVTVYDAEDVPAPDQLRKAAGRFAAAGPKLACLQASLVPENPDDGLIQAFFTLEYATLFDVIKNGISNYGLPMPLGGTSNHFRKHLLLKSGGWDAWNVTEDAELGLRLAHQGYSVERLQSDTLEEAPHRFSIWFNQRRRWCKGWMQTAIAQTSAPVKTCRRQGIVKFLVATLIMAGTLLCMLAFPFGLAGLSYRIFSGSPFFSGSILSATQDWLSLLVAVFGSMAMFLPSCIAIQRRGLFKFWYLVPLLPVYFLIITFAAWVAALDLMFKPFYWHKTEHGFAKTSVRNQVWSRKKDLETPKWRRKIFGQLRLRSRMKRA